MAHYQPRHLALDEQLGVHGVELRDVDVVVNCHLHADHAGGNHLFPGTPIYVQAAELTAADQDDYTVREACVSFADAEFVQVSGRHEGRVLLAGQAFDSASEFASAALARQLGGEPLDVTAPAWVDDLLHAEIDVARFAHDLAQWRPAPISFCGSEASAAW